MKKEMIVTCLNKDCPERKGGKCNAVERGEKYWTDKCVCDDFLIDGKCSHVDKVKIINDRPIKA